jgi:hypothetical protein
LQRAPRPDEVETARELLDKHLRKYRADPDSAKALLATGFAPVASSADPAELAAWTDVARVIFNLHEMITRS